jgi:Na+/melibiose symporter-like transporter
VLLLTLAAFWNDITMGSAWASCLDIGKRYSGIVAGCMNTVGNLGGALAGSATGWILKWHTSPFAPGTAEYDAAKYQGWTVNILMFGAAYVIDASKPVAE